MVQSCNDLLYSVKLHLAANGRSTGSNQRSVTGLVGRNRNDGQPRQRGTTLTNKRFPLSVVKVVVREDQVESTGRKGAPCCRETGNNRNLVRSQELTRDLLREDSVIFEVEDVHGSGLTMIIQTVWFAE
jgi:hypothetical protein